MPGLLRKIVAFLIASLVASWMLPARGFAHGEPAPLAFWGNFSPAIAECQRIIGHAASLCIARTVRARGDCKLAQAVGAECDEAALNEEVQAARARARALVRERCSEQEVQNLRYLDVNEALTDVIGVCRSVDRAAESAIFDAASLAGSGVAPEQAAVCLGATRSGVGKALVAALRERRLVLDRIAATNVAFRDKQALIDRATRRILAGVAGAALAVERECGADAFAAIYGRSASTHLGNAAAQADCFGGAVYVQDAVVCPDPVCGNAIAEAGETCDDGNTVAGDGCDDRCRLD